MKEGNEEENEKGGDGRREGEEIREEGEERIDNETGGKRSKRGDS